jgi:hypothetical protein
MNVDAIPRERLPALLRAMPKAELHIHIEGSLEPELIFALAKKNGIALAYPSVEALRAAYAFTDLQSFLDIYYAGASVLQDESDFEAMTMAYFGRAAADNVIHAEIFFDPQTHTERGVAIDVVIRGLSTACARAERELGVTSSLILCFLRHLSEAEAMQTLEAALPYREHFIGVASTAASAAIHPRSSSVSSRAPASSACAASRTPARRGRRPTSKARSTSFMPSASTTACAAWRARRSWRGSPRKVWRSPSARSRT